MPSGINTVRSNRGPEVEVRPIPDFPDYGVSWDGRIWSYRNAQWRKTRTDSQGYTRINFSINNQVVNKKVHRLVAQLWIPNPLCLPFINHKDCNKANPHADNLEWCTNQHNIQHSFDNDMHPRGERSVKSKLTEKQAKAIRECSFMTRKLADFTES